MSNPDVDEIINYLSTKLNKIFCDREFVSSVSQDFQIVLSKKNKCCVLVFPALGHAYLRAVRYQAKIFDLAVFNITAGPFKSVAVCHKDHILVSNKPGQEEPQKMAEVSTTRRKRPERQLYIPPAQRRSRIQNEEINTDNTNIKSDSSNHMRKKVPKERNIFNEQINVTVLKYENPTEITVGCDKNYDHENTYLKNISTTNSTKEHSVIIPLATILSLHLKQFDGYKWKYPFSNHFITMKEYHDLYCDFYNFLLSHYNKEAFSICVPLYTCTNRVKFYILYKNRLCWQPQNKFFIRLNANGSNYRVLPLFEFTSFNQSTSSCDNLEKNDCAILYSKILSDELHLVNECSEVDSFYKMECDCDFISHSLDLTSVGMGHYFILKHTDGMEYLHDCQEDHDVFLCYRKSSKEWLNSSLLNDASQTISRRKTEEAEGNKFSLIKSDVICTTIKNKSLKNNARNTNQKNENAIIDKNNKHKKSSKKNEHEEEKEIMRKTKENINRKTRPIIRYVGDEDDLLKIDKNDNVNNWEDLFDDSGQLQEELLTEIVQKVGNEVTIVKAAEDYTPYTNKPTEDLEHIVELYNFPPSLGTADLIHAFSSIDSDAMYIKWVDDTHALLVLGSLSQAQRAIEIDHPMIKARPINEASAISIDVAAKSDLKPAMKRPQTNLQTARRLITTHLGAKSKISKEQSAKEKEILKNARAEKRLARQNEKDAWEGNIKSTLS